MRPRAAYGIKLGTRPAGGIEEPTFALRVGDVVWFREGGMHRLTPYVGRLYRRRVQGADEVKIDRILPGTIVVYHYP